MSLQKKRTSGDPGILLLLQVIWYNVKMVQNYQIKHCFFFGYIVYYSEWAKDIKSKLIINTNTVYIKHKNKLNIKKGKWYLTVLCTSNLLLLYYYTPYRIISSETPENTLSILR